MELITDKGTFETFAELRYGYLTSGEHVHIDPGHAGMDEWESGKLHASEVGACPRKQLLRILGAPPKVQNNLTRANEALMFWIAYRVHYLTYEAMSWAGILYDCEVSLMSGVWAGRADAIFYPDVNDKEGMRIYDLKTVRPNAFRYAESYPKEQHCLQLGAYATRARVSPYGVIEYVDRGGSNIPIECPVDVAEWAGKATHNMQELESLLAGVEGQPWDKAELPPVLPEHYVSHYRKARNQPYKDLTSVTLEPSWECSYCLMHHTMPDDSTRHDSPCTPPNHMPILIAKTEKGQWVHTAEGVGDFVRFPERFDKWFDEQPMTLQIPGGEE
jgi:hypothetical protein